MNRVAWIGGTPAHYTRAFHRRLSTLYADAICFTYVGMPRPDRAYEVGALPRDAEVLVGRPGPGEVSRLVRRLRDQGVDRMVVIGHSPRLVWIAGLYGLAKGWPVYYWSDTNLLDVLRARPARRAMIRTVLGRYLSRMTALLYAGTRNREFYTWCTRGRVPAVSMIRLPYPHDHEWFAERPDDEADRAAATLRVTYLGRLVTVKGVDSLIRALRLVPEALLRRTELTIFGDGPCRAELERLANELDLGTRVRFLGSVPSSRTREILRTSDVLVLPSHREPWGLVVNEALSVGKPVVAPYWVGAAGDILIDGCTGVVPRSNAAEELAAGLEALLANDGTRRQLGRRGQALVGQERWSIEGALDGFAQVVA